ncbi:hypothetical protein [Erwinia sorbitola]|uniref:Thymidylate kinase n=1 Tax=Erwinia sorbitola TaxID=2681984 RepID=A0A6I6ES02_9GAMM|nr:hypothetical protein [Erwinia sorbitola]MTD26194.1 hypothetical protein [Erwinia sorbitola]QGU87272.1 hypothetical protein GN242_08635 [Erwinia sorbitola]
MCQQTISFANHAPVRVIAIAGCDGAGKSTLATSLVTHLSPLQPTKLFYLGQSSGRIGKWIGSLPLIGAPFGGYLQAKAARVHDCSAPPPGALTALVIFLLSCWRTFMFRRMLAWSRQGYLMITDRYPQDEMAGFRFDGPQLSKTAGGSWWVCELRKRERKMYQWMASYPPALLIRLDIDAATAHSRKPDHTLSALREKVAVIPHLTFNGAKIVEIDACEPVEMILEKSLDAVEKFLGRE